MSWLPLVLYNFRNYINNCQIPSPTPFRLYPNHLPNSFPHYGSIKANYHLGIYADRLYGWGSRNSRSDTSNKCRDYWWRPSCSLKYVYAPLLYSRLTDYNKSRSYKISRLRPREKQEEGWRRWRWWRWRWPSFYWRNPLQGEAEESFERQTENCWTDPEQKFGRLLWSHNVK